MNFLMQQLKNRFVNQSGTDLGPKSGGGKTWKNGGKIAGAQRARFFLAFFRQKQTQKWLKELKLIIIYHVLFIICIFFTNFHHFFGFFLYCKSEDAEVAIVCMDISKVQSKALGQPNIFKSIVANFKDSSGGAKIKFRTGRKIS